VVANKFVVMFSGGIGSWATARRLVDEHGPSNVTCLFSDVKGDTTDPHIGEDEDTYRFIDDSIAQLGCEYVRVADGRNIWEVFRDRRYLGNSRQANCSHTLKQAPARKWLKENTTPESHTIAIGIDWTETHRTASIEKAYKPWNVVFPMCDAPYLSKDQMIDWAKDSGIEPPRLYAMGFSHNNCGGGCVRAGQAQFRHLLNVMPERYAVWEKGEKDIAEYLNKDVSILREQVRGVRKQLPLSVLRSREESQCDMLDIGGCGCFVEDFSMSDEDNGEVT
jgi:hypothetical protein